LTRIADILRAIFISPEASYLLILFFFFEIYPELFTIIGSQFKSNSQLWQYLPTLPILFTTLVFKLGKSIRVPLDKNKRLYEWDGYHRITDRVFIGIFISMIAAVAAVSIWFLTKLVSDMYLGIIFLSAVGVSGFSAFTMYLASISIKEILDITDNSQSK
jgi:hypothetical protein